MKLNRRSILGMFGGAAVAGPQVAAKLTADMAVLGEMNVGTLAGLAGSVPNPEMGTTLESAGSNISWALKQQARRKLFSMTDWTERKVRHPVYKLDAETASLVSVSLTNKMRISRDRQWKKSEEQEDRWLERLITGGD